MQNHSVVAFAFVLSVGAPFARAQCVNDWLPGDPVTGLGGEVLASLMHDPDGAGPLPPRLVAGGGSILSAGGFPASGVATWDPAAQTWSALGNGPGRTQALAVLANDDLVAAGSFTLGGYYYDAPVARWNGAVWLPLMGASQLAGSARCMVVLPNGDLVVGGDLSLWDGVTWTAAYVARWNGSDWTSLQPPSYTTIETLALLPNGRVLASGQGLGWPNGDLAEWDGTTWSSVASPVGNVRCVTVLANGDVVLCGTLGGWQLGVHRWSGGTWTSLGEIGEVRTIRELPNGDLLAGGDLALPGVYPSLARWNGSAWQPVGTTRGNVATVTVMPTGALFVGGSWIGMPNGDWVSAAQVVGNTWSGLGGSPTFGDVTMALDLSSGDLVVAGSFTRIGGVPAPGLARWDGSSWSPIGGAIDGTILDMVEMPNGDLVVCGEFAKADQVAVTNIARWDGTSWSSLGWTDPLAGYVTPRAIRSLAVMSNGDLMIGGDFATLSGLGAPRFVARYDGATWSEVGLATNYAVRDMVVLPNGDLVVCGEFTAVEQPWLSFGGVQAPRVARWDGTHWWPMGSGMNGRVDHVFLDAHGDLVATGPFTTAGGNVANGIARWDGTSWTGVGATAGAPGPQMVEALPDGDLVRWVQSPSGLERWDGVSWSPMAAVAYPKCLVMRRNGELFVGGTQFVNGAWSLGYARYATNCPATSFAFGGCASSGGANRLVAEQLPYSDGVLRSLASGTSSAALAIVVTGFTSLPSPIALSALLPNAGAGCALAVTDDIVQLQTTTNGTVRSTLAIPSSPPVVGLSFFQQMVVLGVDPVLGIVESTSTNTLRLTVGSF